MAYNYHLAVRINQKRIGLGWAGLDLMAKVGFDPRQSIDLWQNMAKAMEGYTLVVNKPNCKI